MVKRAAPHQRRQASGLNLYQGVDSGSACSAPQVSPCRPVAVKELSFRAAGERRPADKRDRDGEKPKRVLPSPAPGVGALWQNASLGSVPKHGFAGCPANVGGAPGRAGIAGEILGGEGVCYLILRPPISKCGDAEGHVSGGGSARILNCCAEPRKTQG